jgi:hypothetical protein
MALWKKIAIGMAVLALLGGVGATVAFMLTAGTADAATSFVKEVGHQGPDAAYKDGSLALRASLSEDAFDAEMRQWHLTEAADASWSSRTFQGGRATLRGTVTLRSGEAIPVRVDLVKSGSKWQVSVIALDTGVKDEDD